MLAVFTVLTWIAVFYAHRHLPAHAGKPRDVRITRVMLLVVAAAFGYVMSFVYFPVDGLAKVLVFASAFGVVHIPAAGILFLKHQRKRGV